MYKFDFSEELLEKLFAKLDKEENSTKIEKELLSIRQLLDWLHLRKQIDTEKYLSISNKISTFVSNKGISRNIHDRTYSNIRFYLFIFFLLVCILLGPFYYLFRNSLYFVKSEENLRGRVLPFKGVVSTKDGAALDSKRDIDFNLYKDPIGGKPLYNGSCIGEGGLTPAYNGTFSVLIGSDCGMRSIPEELFKDNSSLYLGVRIGDGPELLPRYQIMTSTYQSIVSAMQGKKIGTGNSSIPFIDDKGTLTIDSENPVIQTNKSSLSINGKSISLNALGDVEANIILKPGNDSNVLIENGRLGIGNFSPKYLLTAESKQPFSTVGSIRNLSVQDDEQTSALRLSLGTDPTGTGSSFVEFYAGAKENEDGKKVGSIRINNEGVVYETGGADFAEYFNITYNSEILPGEIISLSSQGLHPSVSGEKIIGAVTNSAGFVGNSRQNDQSVLVGLVGQIEVWVSTIGGEIRIGDRIGGSQIEGFGTIVGRNDYSVGYSLEDSTKQSFANDKCPQKVRKLRDPFGKRIKCGQLSVIVNTD
jgi:hypothetical protein